MWLSRCACTKTNPLPINQLKEWVKKLAPVIKVAGLMLNVAAKLGTGITLVDSVAPNLAVSYQLSFVFLSGGFT